MSLRDYKVALRIILTSGGARKLTGQTRPRPSAPHAFCDPLWTLLTVARLWRLSAPFETQPLAKSLPNFLIESWTLGSIFPLGKTANFSRGMSLPRE